MLSYRSTDAQNSETVFQAHKERKGILATEGTENTEQCLENWPALRFSL
jgi:hypothetical protein